MRFFIYLQSIKNNLTSKIQLYKSKIKFLQKIQEYKIKILEQVNVLVQTKTFEHIVTLYYIIILILSTYFGLRYGKAFLPYGIAVFFVSYNFFYMTLYLFLNRNLGINNYIWNKFVKISKFSKEESEHLLHHMAIILKIFKQIRAYFFGFIAIYL